MKKIIFITIALMFSVKMLAQITNNTITWDGTTTFIGSTPSGGNIGSSWRNGGGPGTLPSLKDNVFYIVF